MLLAQDACKEAFYARRIFRGTQDGRMLAYDAATGKRIWERAIGNPKLGGRGSSGVDHVRSEPRAAPDRVMSEA